MTDRSNEIIEKIKRERPTYTAKTMKSRIILGQADPEYLELFHRMHMHVMREKNALPEKIKEIIISAVNAATGYERGIKIHLRGALEAGASKDEIIEGLLAASLPAGIHVLSLGLPILDDVIKEYEQA